MFKDFSNIKVGDKVIASKSGYGFVHNVVATVTKVNKVSFVCEGNSVKLTFNFNGSERGANGWVNWHCDEYTEEKAEEIYKENRKAHLVSKLSNFNYKDAPLDLLVKINALIKLGTKEN